MTASSSPVGPDGKGAMIGRYTQEERERKILKYKEKMRKRREQIKVSRKFGGRSVVAKTKHRVNGRFVKAVEDISEIPVAPALPEESFN
jgi:hypothetical protein